MAVTGFQRAICRLIARGMRGAYRLICGETPISVGLDGTTARAGSGGYWGAVGLEAHFGLADEVEAACDADEVLFADRAAG